MENIVLNKKDEIVMRLVHYLVTEQNYSPIIVNGAKNEVWLENQDGPYRIIRINSNYIHNNEQLDFDMFKTKSVIKQIKSKTFSFKINTLNIFLDIRDDVKLSEQKNMNLIKIDNIKDLKKNQTLLDTFPDLKEKVTSKQDSLDFIINVTHDINEKTAKDNKIYEETFKKKPLVVTYTLIVINVILYFISFYGYLTNSFDLFSLLILNPSKIIAGHEVFRLLTCTFMHENILHLGFNMYALYIIGSQVETFIGKWKYLVVYIGSALTGSLLSLLITKTNSLGASGAIFGLLGCVLYFGYNYRLYLGEVLKNQIIPLIIVNLLFGFMFSNYIDNFAHIGGLLGGILLSMAVGIKGKTSKSENINGTIAYIILIIFLIYMIFR